MVPSACAAATPSAAPVTLTTVSGSPSGSVSLARAGIETWLSSFVDALSAVAVGGLLTMITRASENSDVLPAGLVAVAVNAWPAVVGRKPVANEALPAASVVTLIAPMKVLPSPWPLASADGLVKNSMEKFVFGVLFSVPATVVPAALT